MIVDTTVFIDLFRDYSPAKQFLISTSEPLKVSRVVLMELIRGLTSRKGIKILLRQMEALGTEVLEINDGISKVAGELFEDYYHAHGLGIMDALVAATAKVYGEKLATHNTKHFKFITGIDLLMPYRVTASKSLFKEE